MRKVPRYQMIAVILVLLWCTAGNAYAKPWRNLKPIPASRITWKKGIIGIVGNDQTRLHHLTGQGGMGVMPFLSQGPAEAELTARQLYIGKWLARHPRAMALPVEAWPYFSKSVARIYVWIVDGPDNLNLEMVREGLLNGDNLMTILQFDDLYITAKQLWAFRRQVAAAQTEAARANRGIWKDPDYQQLNPPDKLFYPGMEPLARLSLRARTFLKENKAGKLLLVAAYRIRDLQIDGVPVSDNNKSQGVFDSWSRQLRGGTSEKQYRLHPGQTLSPGLHTLTGQLDIQILEGIEAWNAAGRARATPGSLEPLATLRLEIDALFNIME